MKKNYAVSSETNQYSPINNQSENLVGKKKAMCFEISHLILNNDPEVFTDITAPDWLTSSKTVKGSTMDNRWFWEEHVLKLNVGQSIETDFHKITRTK